MSNQSKLRRIILDLEELLDCISYGDEEDDLRQILEELQTLHLTEPL